jgi:glycosyltransferase involved in cell wall biosynthesis
MSETAVKTKPKITLIYSDYHPVSSGTGNSTVSTAKALFDAGCAIDVITCRQTRDLPRYEVINGIRVHRILSWTLFGSRKLAIFSFFLWEWVTLIRTLALIKPDYVVGMMLFFGCMADIPKRLFGYKSVSMARGSDVDEVISPLQKFTVTWALRHCDIIVTITTDFKNKMQRRVPREDIHLIPSPIEERDVTVGESPCVFAPGFLHAVGIGRMIVTNNLETKGMAFAIRAVARTPQYQLHLLGDGPYRPTLEALVDELGVRDRVRFYGTVSHEALCGAMKAADVLLFPSQAEGMARTVLEAAYLGLPIITTPIGGQRDYLVEGESVLFVKPGNVDSICRALEVFAASPQLRRRMAEAGKTLVAGQFSYEVFSRRFEEILASAGTPGK